MQLWFRMVAAAIGWFAIALQYYLIVRYKTEGDLVEAAIDLLAFFTMLSNILVALAMTLPWLAPESKLGAFFSRPSVRTAIASYIIVVSAVYYTILRKLWNPEGWQLVADTIEHCVAPALYLIDWLVFVPKGTLRIKSVPWWLIFPVFADPRGSDGLLPLSLPRCDAARLRPGVAEHGGADGCLRLSRPRSGGHRPHDWRRRGAQARLNGTLGKPASVNSLGICWGQDRASPIRDAATSRPSETREKGLSRWRIRTIEGKKLDRCASHR